MDFWPGTWTYACRSIYVGPGTRLGDGGTCNGNGKSSFCWDIKSSIVNFKGLSSSFTFASKICGTHTILAKWPALLEFHIKNTRLERGPSLRDTYT
eukprot:1159439-Pelagomonas_calceolata.AAC.2